MDRKLTGLVLKNVQTGDNKSLVTVLTPDIGKTLVTCYGARKLTSRNMPATQPFCLCEMIVGEKNGRFTLKEACLLESFFDLRRSLEASAIGSYILETGESCAREGENEEALLSLMLNCLYALCLAQIPKEQVKTVYELRLLLELGCAPNLSDCTCCGKELKGSDTLFFSPSEGGCVCGHCKKEHLSSGPVYPVDRGCLKAMDYVLSCPPKRIFSFKLSEKGLFALSRLSEECLIYNLDRSFDSLKFYKEIKQDEIL